MEKMYLYNIKIKRRLILYQWSKTRRDRGKKADGKSDDAITAATKLMA